MFVRNGQKSKICIAKKKSWGTYQFISGGIHISCNGPTELIKFELQFMNMNKIAVSYWKKLPLLGFYFKLFFVCGGKNSEIHHLCFPEISSIFLFVLNGIYDFLSKMVKKSKICIAKKKSWGTYQFISGGIHISYNGPSQEIKFELEFMNMNKIAVPY